MTVRVTTDDVVKAGYCVSGARRQWAAFGLTKAQFRVFVKEGIPVEELADVDDVCVSGAIAVAEAREANDG